MEYVISKAQLDAVYEFVDECSFSNPSREQCFAVLESLLDVYHREQPNFMFPLQSWCGVVFAGPPGGPIVCELSANEPAQANGELIAEAGTVYRETGLTPRQLVACLRMALDGLEAENTESAWATYRAVHGATCDFFPREPQARRKPMTDTAKHYAGIFIGGPLAGQKRIHHAPELAVLTYGSLQAVWKAPAGGKVSDMPSLFWYRHEIVSGYGKEIGYWVPADISSETAFQFLLSEYETALAKHGEGV